MLILNFKDSTRRNVNEKTNILTVDGQKLICPSREQWEDILSSSEINSVSIGLIDLIKEKVYRNFNYPELKSCLGFVHNRVMFYELLMINNDLIRVFVERIICEKCRKKATISATPAGSDIYIGLTDQQTAQKRGFNYPNLKCKYCSKTYEKRHTIWQKYEN